MKRFWKVVLELVDYEANQELRPGVVSTDGAVKFVPVEGSRTSCLHLKAPDGTIIKAQIPHDQLEHVLSFAYPDDTDYFYPDEAITNQLRVQAT